MPSCKNCKFIDLEHSSCKLKGDKHGRSYVRNCITAIWIEEQPLCKGNILEVGGGQWNAPRKTLRSDPNCKYFGVDPKWGDAPEIGGYKGSVCNMSFFENNFFDRVLAFETMEHWQDKEDPIKKGLSEIHRVLKPNGVVCLTVPIHLHGHEIFRQGNLEKIRAYFDDKMWKNVVFQEWRKDYDPLPPSQNWHGNLEYYAKYSTQKIPSSWCLRINATKA
jgi:SAM-dependent methyltransferase